MGNKSRKASKPDHEEENSSDVNHEDIPYDDLPEEFEVLTYENIRCGPKGQEEMLKKGFEIEEEVIRSGSFGTVFKAKSKGKAAAVKIINLDLVMAVDPEQVAKDLPRELKAIQSLRHANIVKVEHIFQNLTLGRVYIFMELATGGNLLEMINAKGRLEEGPAKGIFTQVAKALKYMHSKDWTHRDVKPDNVLLFDEGRTVKLTDFGFSRSIIDPLLGTHVQSRTWKVGAVRYRAPEIFMRLPYDMKPADVWSLGVTLFMILNKEFPFKGPINSIVIIKQQLSGQFQWRDDVIASDNLKSLVRRMFNPITDQRPTMSDILADPWLK